MKRPTLVRLLGFLRPFSAQMALSVLLGLLTVVSGIGLMATAAYLISAAALRPSIAELEVAIVGVRFFGLSRGVFRYLERLVTHSVNFNLLATLRVWFYRQVEPLAPAGLIDARGGDLLARAVADVEALEGFYVRAVSPPLVALGVGLGILWFLGSFTLGLALAMGVFWLVGGGLLPWLVSLLSRAPARRLVEARANLTAALVGGIQGLPDLLAFNCEVEYQDRLAGLGQAYTRSQARLDQIASAQAAFSGLLANLGLWVILVLAIPLVASGQLNGVYLAVLALAGLASFEALAGLPQAAQSLEISLAAARRLFEVANRPPLVMDPKTGQLEAPTGVRTEGLAPELRVSHLSFRYPPEPGQTGESSRPWVLEDISFNLGAGQRLALVGPSGAGKSTLVSLLLRFWDYRAGEITLGGTDLRALPLDQARAHFSVIAQTTYLFDATLRQNLLLARPGAAPHELESAVEGAQLGDFVRGLPDGLDTWVGEHGLRLSGGERQRVAIARALLKDAPFLILDEPTANLDRPAALRFFETLYRVYPRRSLLLITHQLEGMQAMQEILVLDGGRVIERGRHADLLAQGGLYARMVAIQQETIPNLLSS